MTAHDEPSGPEAAYIDHVVAQIQASLDFLVQQHQISRPDANLIKSKLPRSTSTTPSTNGPLGMPTAGFSNLSLQSQGSTTSGDHHPLQNGGQPQQSSSTPPDAHPLSMPVPTPSAGGGGPPLPRREASEVSLAPVHKRAKALWTYAGTASDDLSFQKDDIIYIQAEENSDWWRGSLRPDGPSGLFPSNHVHLLSPADPSSNHSPTSLHDQHGGSSGPAGGQVPPYPPNQTAPYPPQGQNGWGQQGGYQSPPVGGYGSGPKPGVGPEQMYGNPGQQVSPPPQQGQEVIVDGKKPKKPFQGRLGQAFVGGVGFGAGSSIAGHVVNAIL